MFKNNTGEQKQTHFLNYLLSQPQVKTYSKHWWSQQERGTNI